MYFKAVAKALNESGYGVKKFYAEVKKTEIDFTDSLVKELLWKPIQMSMTEKMSTTEVDTDEVGHIYENLNRVLSEIGIHVTFPSKEH